MALVLDYNNDNLKIQPEPEISRVWCDGCFDMMHYGHANALRQAKKLGTFLIAGIHSSDEIKRHKGPPVLTLEERVKLVRSVKWVDQVVMNAPYAPSVNTLDKFGCDFCVHAEDIAMTAEGVDSYAEIKAADRYRYCKRTPGVSTTDLIRRILSKFENDQAESDQVAHTSPWTTMGDCWLTSQIIAQFSSLREPTSSDTVIYVPGAFDCFHVGHIDFLESVRKLGNYVIVGLYSDETIRKYKGSKFPIMTLQERLLCALACKYVDNIVIEAPYNITNDFLERFKIDLVCHGKLTDSMQINGIDPFKEPKCKRKFKIVSSGCSFTVEKLIDRVLKDRTAYMKRNQDKVKKEATQYDMWQKLQANGEVK